MKRHFNIRPYQCNVCMARFARSSTLKIHYHIHTGEKPHKCPFEGCKRTFSERGNMNTHHKTHLKGGKSDNSSDNNTKDREDSSPKDFITQDTLSKSHNIIKPEASSLNNSNMQMDYSNNDVNSLLLSNLISNNIQGNEYFAFLKKLNYLNKNGSQNYSNLLLNLLAMNNSPNSPNNIATNCGTTIVPVEENFSMVSQMLNLNPNILNLSQVTSQPTSAFTSNVNSDVSNKNVIKSIFNDFLHSNEITPRGFFGSNPATPSIFFNGFINQNVLESTTPNNNILLNQFNSAFKTQATPKNVVNVSNSMTTPMGSSSPKFLQPQNTTSMSFSEMVNLTKKVFG